MKEKAERYFAIEAKPGVPDAPLFGKLLRFLVKAKSAEEALESFRDTLKEGKGLVHDSKGRSFSAEGIELESVREAPGAKPMTWVDATEETYSVDGKRFGVGGISR